MEDNSLRELVETTKAIKELTIRQKVLRLQASQYLIQSEGKKIEFKDKSRITLSYRKKPARSIEDRVDDRLLRENAKAIYNAQKRAFTAELEAACMMVSNSEWLEVVEPGDKSNPVLVVSPKREDLNPDFKSIKLGEGFKKAEINDFLDLFYIGKKFGDLDIDSAWSLHNEEITAG